MKVTPCIIVGPPATGKSSLKHLLVHNTPKAVKTSTAVIDTPEVVTTEQYAVEGGTSAWQLVSKDVMERSLQVCVASNTYDEGKYPAQHRSKAKQKDGVTPLSLPSTSQAQGQNPIQRLKTFLEKVTLAPLVHRSAFRQSGGRKSTGDSEIVTLLDEEHSRFLHDLAPPGQGIQLNDASLVHLLDTGGQPSFQDALPLLLDVPCTYIQVFNAASDLDQPVPITYRRDDHTEESLPPTTETGWEVMLRSFSSMHTLAQKSSKEMATFQQEGSQLPQFRIFVVGTFKDQLMEEGRHEEAVRDINKCLNQLKKKPYYPSMQKDTAGQQFHLINNLSGKDDEIPYVNSLREQLSATRSALKLKVPLMWYLCEQITKCIPQKFIRFQDLKAFCLKHKFIDANDADEQFRSLLKLFSLLGFYSFFDLKEVPDEDNYVCTDKSMFVKEVSKLLAVQFVKAPRCHAVEVFKRDGIISNSREIFEELEIREELDRSWFLAALEHVGLLARYSSASDHSPNRSSYFMPIALPQGKTKLPDCSSVASLCVSFVFCSPGNPLVYTDLPRGVFCRLAVQLSNGPWTPIPEESDRTTVKFYTDKFELYLTEAPGFIRLTPVLVEELEGKEPLAELHTLCQRLYSTLRESIVPSAEDVLGEEFNHTATIVFGFECDCGKVPHLATPVSAEGQSGATLEATEGKSLICQATQTRHRSLKKKQIWCSPVDGIKVRVLNVWYMNFPGLVNQLCPSI